MENISYLRIGDHKNTVRVDQNVTSIPFKTLAGSGAYGDTVLRSLQDPASSGFCFLEINHYLCGMNVLKVEKKTKHRVDQLKLFVLILCLLNDIHLSDTYATVLAYFMQYKVSTKTDYLIIKSGIVKNAKGLKNIKSRLHKLGFLRRNPSEYNSYELNFKAGFSLDDNDLKLLLTLNNN